MLAISASDLYDRGAMAAHFKKLVRWLQGKDRAAAVAAEVGWFRAPVEQAAPGAAGGAAAAGVAGDPLVGSSGWPAPAARADADRS